MSPMLESNLLHDCLSRKSLTRAVKGAQSKIGGELQSRLQQLPLSILGKGVGQYMNWPTWLHTFSLPSGNDGIKIDLEAGKLQMCAEKDLTTLKN